VLPRDSATVSRETDPLSTFSSRDVAIALRTQHHTDCRQTAYDPSKTGLHRRLRWLCHSGLSARPLGEGSPANAYRCVIPGSRPQYSAYMHGLLQSEVQIRFDRHFSFSVSRETGSPMALPWPAEQQVVLHLDELSGLRSKTVARKAMPHPVSRETVPNPKVITSLDMSRSCPGHAHMLQESQRFRDSAFPLLVSH